MRIKSIFPVLFVILALGAAGCQKKKEAPKVEAVPVAVAQAVQKDVPIRVKSIGNVSAYSTVKVIAQVGGALTKVHFTEGQFVAKGDPLFTIDPRPYQAQVKQLQADLARAKAQLENAVVQDQRYSELVKKGYVSQDQYDQIHTNLATLRETVNSTAAALDNAVLQLGYCLVQSPISGRTGNLLIHPGNIIKANGDDPLIVINQVQPVYVTFSVPEMHQTEIRTLMKRGRLPVEAAEPDGETIAQGTLTFVDNSVNQNTGAIQLKAVFPNRDLKLWPGAFVNALLTLHTRANAVVIPTPAVQLTGDQQFVYVVKGNSTVEKRVVAITNISEEETIVDSGIRPGETVVTDGQLRLIPGTKIEIKK